MFLLVAVVCWLSIYFGVNSDWYMWLTAILSSFIGLAKLLGGSGGSGSGSGSGKGNSFFDIGGDGGCGGDGGGCGGGGGE